jgi:beta-lactamase regulating signal transducer with metallopeptidase domain
MMPSIVLTQRLLAATIETAVAAAIVAMIAAMIGRRAPRVVALLWLAVLAKPLVTLFVGPLVPVPMPPEGRVLATRVDAQANVVAEVTRINSVDRNEVRRTVSVRNPGDSIAVIWLAGALLLLGRTVYNRRRLQVIVRDTHTPSPALASAYARLTRGLARAPRLRVSEAIDGPAIGGALRPVILIPAWLDAAGDEAQIGWTLRHELRHATARDTLGIALRELALIVFWFHPAVWLAAKKWEAAAELACDRDVVRSDAEAVDYADALYRTLLNVRQHRRLQLASGLFATRSKIGTRIAALVERPLAPRIGRAGVVAAGLIGVALLAVGAEVATRGHSHGNLEEVIDGRRTNFRYDGVVEFSNFTGRINHLSDRGFVSMQETRDGITREVRLDGGPDGIARSWRVNGRDAPPDEAWERAMTSDLRRAIRR